MGQKTYGMTLAASRPASNPSTRDVGRVGSSVRIHTSPRIESRGNNANNANNDFDSTSGGKQSRCTFS
jgi:hypothetical protein